MFGKSRIRKRFFSIIGMKLIKYFHDRKQFFESFPVTIERRVRFRFAFSQLTLIVQEMFKNDEGFKLAGVLRSQAAEGIDDVG